MGHRRNKTQPNNQRHMGMCQQRGKTPLGCHEAIVARCLYLAIVTASSNTVNNINSINNNRFRQKNGCGRSNHSLSRCVWRFTSLEIFMYDSIATSSPTQMKINNST
eukprot:12145987-Ditylum_brightwellii.AAC.1